MLVFFIAMLPGEARAFLERGQRSGVLPALPTDDHVVAPLKDNPDHALRSAAGVLQVGMQDLMLLQVEISRDDFVTAVMAGDLQRVWRRNRAGVDVWPGVPALLMECPPSRM